MLPHPLRRLAGERAIKGGRTPPKPETVAALPQWEAVHAIEVASTQTTTLEHTLTAAALAVAPRPAVGASDAHGPGLAGTYATELDRTVRTAEELAAEIRAGHVRPARLDLTGSPSVCAKAVSGTRNEQRRMPATTPGPEG